jgi:predicted exporter
VQEVIDKAMAQGLQKGVTAEVIGTLPHTLANIKTVKSDLRFLLPLATLSRICFLIFSFRNARGVLVVAIPFLAALPAIVLQNLICGKVSGLALGFGIVLTGLAVDFAVHIYLALCREPGGRIAILQNLRRPILLAWCTTTSVFGVLLLSSIPSHRQMAVLAIAGITLAVIISWLLVPTISGKCPLNKVNEEPVSLKRSHSRLPIVLWIILIVAGATCWPWLEFNGDMRVLDATNEQLKAVDSEFHKTWRGSVEQALLLSRGTTLDQALNVNDTVFSYLSGQDNLHFQSVAPILPGPDIREKRLERWDTFWQKNRENVADRLSSDGKNLGFRAGSFDPPGINGSPAAE